MTSGSSRLIVLQAAVPRRLWNSIPTSPMVRKCRLGLAITCICTEGGGKHGLTTEGLLLEKLLSHRVHKVQPTVVTGYTSLIVYLAIQVQSCVFYGWVNVLSLRVLRRGHVSKSSRFQLRLRAYLFVEVTLAPFYKFSSIKLHGFILSCYLRFQSPKSI